MPPRRKTRSQIRRQVVAWITHRKPDVYASESFVRYGTLIVAALSFLYTMHSNEQRDVMTTVREEIHLACSCCVSIPHEARK